jgi:predicted NAD/FAD-dependent oxidoreductase
MKQVAIIGAGLCGLRAAWELVDCGRFRVVMVDKSPSVGGRVATRRFENCQVNHGAERFDGFERILKADGMASEWEINPQFSGAATELPKKLRDLLVASDDFTLKTHWQVRQVREGEVFGPQDEKFTADYVIHTAPLPQVEAIHGSLLANVTYTKTILFIGERERKAQRIEMDAEWSEKHFELSDDLIVSAGAEHLKQDLRTLTVKKWRYSRVTLGLPQWFLAVDKKQFVAGDAFDPAGRHDLSASWLSGLHLARHIMEINHV